MIGSKGHFLNSRPANSLAATFSLSKSSCNTWRKISAMLSKCSLRFSDPFATIHPQPPPARIPPPVHPKEKTLAQYPSTIQSKWIKGKSRSWLLFLNTAFPLGPMLQDRMLSFLMFSKWSHILILHVFYRWICRMHRKMNDTQIYGHIQCLGCFIYNIIYLIPLIL